MSFDEDKKNDPAWAALNESGEGVSEGFELAEEDLIEHASHGDEHSAGRILQDAFGEDEDDRVMANEEGGEADEAMAPDLGEKTTPAAEPGEK
jgi:hypothetical protein